MATKRSAQRHDTLLAWRRGARLNQREAARIFGVSQTVWWRIETGLRPPRPKLGKAIADKTGVPLERVLGL